MATGIWDQDTRWRLASWGHELYEQGAYGRAATVFAALLEEDASDGYAVQALAACHLAAGDAAEAVVLLRGWLNGNPAHPPARLRLAEALAALGQKSAAAAELAAMPASGAGPAQVRLQFSLGL